MPHHCRLPDHDRNSFQIQTKYNKLFQRIRQTTEWCKTTHICNTFPFINNTYACIIMYLLVYTTYTVLIQYTSSAERKQRLANFAYTWSNSFPFLIRTSTQIYFCDKEFYWSIIRPRAYKPHICLNSVFGWILLCAYWQSASVGFLTDIVCM